MSIGSPIARIQQATTAELVTHSLVAVTILACATILGLHGEFNSGDLLAVFTTVATGTSAVASARAGASNNARARAADSEGNGK